ncbi:hypothetical protein VM1G_09107 [Cytospora mali]|uniref:Uncharacterized protein n=1 Tax=Cytospora mali TaxID=578113 RepID=A0A194WBM6_CYTMA|nr:hypothetical protein VM1G_09107 [Valsa mali]
MADPSHVLTISTPAVIEWMDSEGQIKYQCVQEGRPSATTHLGPRDAITLDIHFDYMANAGFFKLRVPFSTTVSKTGESIFLFIPPERITALSLKQPDSMPKEVRDMLKSSLIRLQFCMDRPAHLVVPHGDLLPKGKFSRDNLCALSSVVEETTVTLYIPQRLYEKFQALSDALSRGGVQSIQEDADMTCLFRGKGGRVLTDVKSLLSSLAPANVPDTLNSGEAGPSGIKKQDTASRADDAPLPPYPELPPFPTGSSSSDALIGNASKKRRRSSSDFGREELPPMLRHIVNAMCGSLGQEIQALREELHAAKQQQAVKNEEMQNKLDATRQELDTTRQELDATRRELDATKLGSDATAQESSSSAVPAALPPDNASTDLGSQASTASVAVTRDDMERLSQRQIELYQKCMRKLRRVRTASAQYVDQQLEDVKNSVRDFNAQLEEAEENWECRFAEVIDQTEAHLDLAVDECLADAKAELEGYLRDDVRNTEYAVLQRLQRATLSLDIELPESP